ncbi:MAG: hypothetical protein OXG05_09460 [Gammaproteobacteria bacterium]|nr:hypothetical protein [Gammaproteobacteria bacterium]
MAYLVKREDDRPGGATVSFLDVIACAFGAIVLLVLILPIGELGVLADSEPVNTDYGQLVLQQRTLDSEIDALTREIEVNRVLLERLGEQSNDRDARSTQVSNTIESTSAELNRLHRSTTATKSAIQELRSRAQQAISTTPSEYAGIPVDSEYVIFVIDTSLSMRSIWYQVTEEVEGVLSLYPEMKGFQILSDEGGYLYKTFRKRWLDDSPQLRQRALSRLKTWRAFSTSSPAKGIKVALRDLYDSEKKIALFIFGDDFSGSEDLDEYIRSIDQVVSSANVAEGTLRIHAFGFENDPGLTWSPLRFSVLMHELTQRNGGAFLALPLAERQLQRPSG